MQTFEAFTMFRMDLQKMGDKRLSILFLYIIVIAKYRNQVHATFAMTIVLDEKPELK